MKKTYLLMLVLIMGALIVSCTNQEEEKEITMAADSPEQVEVLPKEPMPASEAQAMIKAYWPLHSQLMTCIKNPSKVPQYINIPGQDLKSMVKALGDDPNLLYASMVEKEVEGKMVTALVFAGKTKAQEGTTEWTYFDFTKPCPPACDTAGISGN